MSYYKELANGRWFTFSFDEQMGNLGADISRAANWSDKDKKMSQLHFKMGLELLDLTIKDLKNHEKLIQLNRLREMLIDWFLGENKCGATGKSWDEYFYPFSVRATAKYYSK